MNVFLICRQTSVAVWLAGFRLKIFRLIKLHASSFQLTFMPRSNLLHYLKGHCFHWKHSVTNMMIQYSHTGICRALFSISFLSERWISLSFRLTFCCWLGVSWRKLHILFRALILMNVSIEQYSDVSCFRKWETRVLLIAWVHAYWEETKLNSLQSSSVGSRIWLHKVMCWILNFICDFKVAQSIHGAVLGNLPKHCDKDGWILFRKYSCTVPNTQKSDSWDIFICKNLYCCTAEFWNNRFFCCCCFCFAVVVYPLNLMTVIMSMHFYRMENNNFDILIISLFVWLGRKWNGFQTMQSGWIMTKCSANELQNVQFEYKCVIGH